MIGVPLLVAVIAFWFWFTGGRYVSTTMPTFMPPN
jgi:hypothetical protein